MPEMEFTIDKIYKARRQARQAISKSKQEGIEQGKQLGIEQGKQLGIEKGIEKGKQLGIEQGKLEMVKRFLQAGFDEEDVCKAAQLSKQELAKIKRSLG